MPFALFIDFSMFIDLPKVFIDFPIVFTEFAMGSIDVSMVSIDFSMHNMHLVNMKNIGRNTAVLGLNSGNGCYHSVGWFRVYLGLVYGHWRV